MSPKTLCPKSTKFFWGFFSAYLLGLLFTLFSIGLSTNATVDKNVVGGFGICGLVIHTISLFALFIVFLVVVAKKCYGDALKFLFLPLIAFIIFSAISSAILAGTNTSVLVPATAIKNTGS